MTGQEWVSILGMRSCLYGLVSLQTQQKIPNAKMGTIQRIVNIEKQPDRIFVETGNPKVVFLDNLKKIGDLQILSNI